MKGSRRTLLQGVLICIISILITTTPISILAAPPSTKPGGGGGGNTKPSFVLNFNTLEFTGTVGQKDIEAVYKNNNKTVSQATYSITANSNYSLSVSGQDVSDGAKIPQTLTIQRIKLSIDNGTALPVTTTPTVIDSSATGPINVTRNVSFFIDLTDSNNNFPDNATLTNLSLDTDFTGTIIFSFTGL